MDGATLAIEAARLFVKVGADTREGEAGLKSFNDKLNASARSLGLTGAALSAGVTLPLVAMGKSALTMAADYEQTMNVLQQVSGASAGAMSALNEQALQLGADTVFSAGEAAEGMLELAKAGMTTQQVMAAIPGVMDLAAAGGVGLATAAGLTAATLNAFHLEASESARVADLLAAAANASAADISDLGQGMQQAGFAFSMANQPVDNLAASLAILTNVGLTGSDAGTALKNAFIRMMNPTKEAMGVMNQLGISFYDAQGNMRDLPDIIDNLNTATASLTKEQRDQALATLFLSDGMKAFIPLMDAGKDGFNGMLDAVNETGAATDVANARMGGLKGGLEELSGAVESFAIGAAQPFLGTLGDLARGAADVVSWFGELPRPVINATLAFLGVMAAAGPVIAGLGLMAGALAFLLTGTGAAVVGVAALAAAWAADVGGIQEVTASLGTTLLTFGRYIERVSQSGQAFNSTLFQLPKSLASFAFGVGQALVSAQQFGRNLLNLGSYVGEVLTQGKALNIWLFTMPPALARVAFGIGNAIVSAQQFGRNLLNLGSYISDVVANGNALNIWLFTMSPAFSSFAFNVGKGIVSLQNFAAAVDSAIAKTKFPTLDELWADFQAGDGDVVANKIRDTAYTLMVNLNTELQITAKANEFRSQLLGVINGVGEAISGLDFATAKTNMDGLRGRIKGEIETLLGGISWSTLNVNFGGLITALGQKITAQADDLLGPDNLISRTVDRLNGLMTTLRDTASGVDATQPLDVLNGAINSIVAIVTTIGGIRGDALQTGIDALHKTTTAALDFGTLLTQSLDTNVLADAASGIATGLATQIKAAFAPGKMETLGISFGGFGVAIASKLGDVLSKPEFGTKLGLAVGEATGAFIAGASALVKGIMQQIGTQDISLFQGNIDSFVKNFTGGVVQGLINAEWSAVGGAIRDGIITGIQTAFAERNIFSFLPGPLGWVAGGLGRAGGMPTLGDTFDKASGLKLPEMERPEWLTELVEWKPAAPLWVTGLLLWSSTVPVWISNLTNLNLDFDFSDLVNWEFTVPDDFLNWKFPSPTDLIEWKFPSPTELISWGFPSPSELLDWDWPSMSMPSWVSSLIGALGGARSSFSGGGSSGGGGGGGGGGFGSNASGTSYWRGGLTWVGEEGPELVDVPQGSRIYSNPESMAMAAEGERVTVQFTGPIAIANDMDIEMLVNKVLRRIQQRMR